MSLYSTLEPITETGTQQFCVEMMKRLNIQRKNEQFWDVILEVGSGEDQARLKAHKNVLCAASPFFFNALNSDMKEKEEGVIRLEETSKAIMEGVLEFMYTGHVEVSKENVYELFTKADYFILPSLKSFCSNFIIDILCFSNCITAYYFAMSYEWEELVKETRAFILSNFVAVAETEDFLNLSCKQVEEWISSDEIIVDAEEKVFEIVLKWTERDESRKQQHFLDLFQHVRCVYLSRDYLFQVILAHPFVRENSECSALILDTMKLAFDGTEECFFSQSPRNCLKSYEDTIVACGEGRVLCYLPSSKVWFKLQNMKQSHKSPDHAVCVCHGKLYAIGGLGSNVVERYEPSLNLWNLVKDPDIVTHSSAAVTLQGFLYLLGGNNSQHRLQNTVQKYNPDSNLWQAVTPLSSPRRRVCAVADGSYLYAIGGSDSTNQYLDIVERYDPRNNTWDKLPSMLARRADAGGAAIKQKVFVFGGLQEEATDSDPCEMYDPATNMWSGIPSLAVPRQITSAVSFKGRIFVMVHDGDRYWFNMSLQVYDVEQNQWEPCTDLPGSNSSRSESLKISCLRVSKDVLARCQVLS